MKIYQLLAEIYATIFECYREKLTLTLTMLCDIDLYLLKSSHKLNRCRGMHLFRFWTKNDLDLDHTMWP